MARCRSETNSTAWLSRTTGMLTGVPTVLGQRGRVDERPGALTGPVVAGVQGNVGEGQLLQGACEAQAACVDRLEAESRTPC